MSANDVVADLVDKRDQRAQYLAGRWTSKHQAGMHAALYDQQFVIG